MARLELMDDCEPSRHVVKEKISVLPRLMFTHKELLLSNMNHENEKAILSSTKEERLVLIFLNAKVAALTKAAQD